MNEIIRFIEPDQPCAAGAIVRGTLRRCEVGNDGHQGAHKISMSAEDMNTDAAFALDWFRSMP